jgi:hypothetical protein
MMNRYIFGLVAWVCGVCVTGLLLALFAFCGAFHSDIPYREAVACGIAGGVVSFIVARWG